MWLVRLRSGLCPHKYDYFASELSHGDDALLIEVRAQQKLASPLCDHVEHHH